MIKYKPPYEDYHAPKYMQEMGPPNKDYKPPGTMTQIHPPASDYHAPNDMVEYRPPSKNYVPPPPSNSLDHHVHSTTTFKPVHFSRGALDSPFMTPSKEYVPPPGSKVPMKPPSAGYAVPQEAQFHPPSKEYLPPPPHPSELPPEIDHNPHHVPMTPPDQEYVSPKSGKKLVVDGVHFQLPTEDYLPPHHKEHRGEHGLLIPPVKEYIPPHVAAGQAGIVYRENHGGKLIPPSKEYLAPDYYNQKPHDVGPHAKYHPPTQEYFSPASDHPHPQNGLAFAPPSKEYHTPIDYKVKELQPQHHPTLVPPSKEYLPPPSNSIEGIGHAIHVNEHHQHHVTALPTFLPPHEVVHTHPKGSIAPTFLPPHDKHVLAHHSNHGGGDGTVAPTFLPPHDGVPHITASLNNKDHHGQAHVTSVTKDGPHSINIQIHMEPHPGEGGDHFPKFTSPLFRTSKPPAQFTKDHPHAYEDHGAVKPHMLPDKPQYEPKVRPHMLPHTGHYEEEIQAHHGPSHHGLSHHGPPPSLPQYVPPPISTHAESYAYKPEHGLPPREYNPIGHSLHPKQYLPTNPLAYVNGGRYRSHDLKRPTVVIPKEVDPMRTLKPPFSDFRPPSEIDAPVRAEGYIPPPPAQVAAIRGVDGNDYIPPAEPTAAFVPPIKDYLPPRILPELVTDDPEIPVPPLPEELPLDIDDGLPSRGPQSPLNLKKEYVEPPPREVLNSQIAPPVAKDKDPYIPPKTKFDVPKNFVRLEDADFDPNNQVELDFGTIDVLDAEQLPEPPSPDFVPNSVGEAEDLTEQPFLGLAKLTSASLKQGQSLKELEQLRDEVKKLAKLIEKPEKEGPKLPPMPTIPTLTSLTQTGSLPPQPSSFVPFLEKLQPSVLQQLQANIRNSNQQGGKIPGKPGVDYPDFKTIPATDFTCENFILEGFYADTFTSCQVNSIQIITF